ncbi:MAG TPA: type II toxin-antitoxin system VapC family toxin [Polyangiales bacterium]|nr:type II toxin-antitoxin system VapC family toxin [Polyangiales bacterium]
MVIDASVVLAAAIDGAASGNWARGLLARASPLVAPHLLPVEVTHRLRKLTAQGLVPEQVATLELVQIAKLSISYFPFLPLMARVWELRNNVSAYDAWYVALAEALKAPLATLDTRLVRASGPTCQFQTYV